MKIAAFTFSVALVVFGFPVLAGEGNGPTPHPLGDEPVSSQPGLHAVTLMIDWAPGASTGKHIHPGDEYATVLEGELTIITDGQGTKIYKAGQSYHNSRGVVHETRNDGKVAAKSVAVLATDKGVPTSQPVH